MKYNIIALLIFVVGTIVFTGLLLQSRKQELPAEVTTESPTPESINDGCPAGFDVYKTNKFSICYPIEFKAPEASSAAQELVFSSENKTLRILPKSVLFPIDLCNVQREVDIASVSAVRTTFKKDSVAGCGKAYRFLTVFTVDDAPYSIDFEVKSGTFESSEAIEIIEKSFQLAE